MDKLNDEILDHKDKFQQSSFNIHSQSYMGEITEINFFVRHLEIMEDFNGKNDFYVQIL